MNISKAYYSLVSVVFVRDKVASIVFLSSYKNFKEPTNISNDFDALLSDLPKACDCFNHKHLISKLFCHGVSSLSFNLSNRFNEIKIEQVTMADVTWKT